MTSVIDDDVIRTRLLLDGEGAGDDRKLTLILKSFLKVALYELLIKSKIQGDFFNKMFVYIFNNHK